MVHTSWAPVPDPRKQVGDCPGGSQGSLGGRQQEATGIEGWTIAWMGRGGGGPKAWTLRVELKMQGLKPEAEDWGVQANQGEEGVRQGI